VKMLDSGAMAVTAVFFIVFRKSVRAIKNVLSRYVKEGMEIRGRPRYVAPPSPACEFSGRPRPVFSISDALGAAA
jgi:hypothetical protein